MHGVRVLTHSFRFVGRVQTALQMLVVGRYTGRAGVAIALQSLDAAQSKHEATRRDNEIGASAILSIYRPLAAGFLVEAVQRYQ